MIQLTNVDLQLGNKTLLQSSSLSIYPGQKWGLIGANGAGKSSFFKLLLGELHEDLGQLSIPKDWKLSHMGQEVGSSDKSALDHILDGDAELRLLEDKIYCTKDGERLAEHWEQMQTIDGYTARARAQQLLFGLGFKVGDDERAVRDFSGGWRIRLNLAQALMCRSDCLLLDEPTNHLDLDATIWLEGWLKTYPGTLLIISHDRDFLDNVIENVVSIDAQQLHSYSGNYSAYERQKAERLAQQDVAFRKQQERVKEIEDFVRRFRAKASKAKQAQSRLKELERMESIAPAHVDSPFSFQFPQPEKLPQSLISLSEASIGYSADKPLASNIELSILDSSRLGLLGSNGAGKSTLIKTLAGELSLLQGTRSEGTHLKIGYFAQHQLEALDLQASCILHLQRLSPTASEQIMRNFLGSFGFSGDRAFEAICHFSGGEKARLALAIVAWQKPNLLLLDEPTNHLDLEMRYALTLALQNFEGAIVVVSHDRHLLKNTCDSFLLVDHGKVENFDGTLEDYQQLLSKKGLAAKADDNGKSKEPSGCEKKGKRQSAAQQRELIKPLKNAIQKLEKDLEKLHGELDVIEQALSASSLYENPNGKLEELVKKQAKLRSELEQKEEEWLLKSEEMDEINSNL